MKMSIEKWAWRGTMIVFVCFLGAGCASQSNVSPGAGIGGSWQLESWSDTAPLPSRVITLDIYISNGKVTGNSACNEYSGDITVNGSQIHVGTLGSTFIVCPDTGPAEQTYRSLLQEVTSWSIEQDVLTLANGQTKALVFSRVSATPTMPWSIAQT
jgi:heat shock protein HslJ